MSYRIRMGWRWRYSILLIALASVMSAGCGGSSDTDSPSSRVNSAVGQQSDSSEGSCNLYKGANPTEQEALADRQAFTIASAEFTRKQHPELGSLPDAPPVTELPAAQLRILRSLSPGDLAKFSEIVCQIAKKETEGVPPVSETVDAAGAALAAEFEALQRAHQQTILLDYAVLVCAGANSDSANAVVKPLYDQAKALMCR